MLLPLGGSATAAQAQRADRAFQPSTYTDPCEHTGSGAGVGDAAVDLRELVISSLYANATATAAEVTFTFELCAPVDEAAVDDPTVGGLRVDIHPRLDGPGSGGTEHSETASRSVLVRPTPTPGSWEWLVRDSAGTTLGSGSASITGDPSGVTAVDAVVPAELVEDAGPGRTSPSGLPPLAIRACSADDDCGPRFEEGPFGPVEDSDDTPRADVDYLPDPALFQLTYPSVCQPSTGAGYATRANEVLATGRAVERLRKAGWRSLGHLEDGSVRFRGSFAAARRVVGDVGIAPVGIRRAAAAVPNDPYFDGTAGAATGQWSLQRVGAPDAWDVTTGSSNARIAILDSGFDGLHPDLAGKAVEGRDFVAGRVDDERILNVNTDTDLGGHGTRVASIAAARTNDGNGMAGMGWDSRLLIARVFDAEGCASDPAVIAAMDWARSRGAAVLNLSLGGPQTFEPLREAGERALAQGVVPVAASGNTGGLIDDYPASYDEYLSVGATGWMDPADPGEDPRAFYSTRNAGVEIVAPGGSGLDGLEERDVLAACWESAQAPRGFCRVAGTSFATPVVVGALALMDALDPLRTPDGQRQLLADTARDLTQCSDCTVGRDVATGFGMLRADLAVQWLGQQVETLQQVTSSADPTTASIAASRAAFPSGGATIAAISRDDIYPDALAGSALVGGNGPLLLTRTTQLEPAVEGELRRLLAPGARVYILGGVAAVSQAVEDRLRALGFDVQRRFGQTRYETAEAIALEVGRAPTGQVLVASGANWPDAVAGGAYAAAHGTPLVLSRPDSANLTSGLVQTLRTLDPADIVLLGGTAALSQTVEDELRSAFPGAGVRRAFGQTRQDTAVDIARQLWGRTVATTGDDFILINGWRAEGWAHGLAAAPLAARNDAPLLLMRDRLEFGEPEAYLRAAGYRLLTPAEGLLIGPATQANRPLDGPYTTQRLREVLGG